MANETVAETSPSDMTIDKLAAMDDSTLLTALGFTKQLENAREAIAEMQKLSGKAREEAESRIENMFAPHVYPNEFKYIVEDAKRAANRKDGKAALCDCSPCSVL